MYTGSIKIVIDDTYSLQSAVFADETGAEPTLNETGKRDILEQVLARLGIRELITQIDGKTTKVQILDSAGKQIVLSITNQVDINDAGERDWGCAAHVLVDGVLSGHFSFDTTCPLFCDIETINGILQSLGIEIEMEFLGSAV